MSTIRAGAGETTLTESQASRPKRSNADEPVEIRIGELIALGIVEADDMRWYQSKVLDLTDVGIEVAPPIDEREILRPAIGTRCGLLFTKPRDARYLLRTEIGLSVGADPRQLWVARAGQWRRIQDRGDVRVVVTILGPCCNRVRPTSDSDENPNSLRVVVQDLSASGVQLWSQDELRIGDQVSVTLELPNAPDPIQAVAEVVRLDVRKGTQFAWHAGARFRSLGTRDRDQIVRFVFERQRELIRSSLTL